MVSDAGVAEVLAPSNAADYLESLGLRYSQRLQRTAVDISATRPVADPTQIYAIESDVLVVIRTDRLAGRGGYDGLPRQPPLSGRQPVTAHHLRADALPESGVGQEARQSEFCASRYQPGNAALASADCL